MLGEGRCSGKLSLGLVWENEDEKNSSSLVFCQKEKEHGVLTLKACSKLSQLPWFQSWQNELLINMPWCSDSLRQQPCVGCGFLARQRTVVG